MGNNPLFIIRVYGELFSRTEFSDEQSSGQLYKIMGFFLSICFCALREMAK